MRWRLLGLYLTDLLFHELHLHKRTPILVGGSLLSGDEVHRQDVPILLRTSLALLVVPE